MLPWPGAPGASWAVYRERTMTAIHSPSLRTAAGFFLIGLINNVLYVIILSAAADLVGPSIPKGVVLLADVLPGFLAKLFVPYFIHLVPYSVRVCVIAGLSASGMLLVATSPASTDGWSLAVKLAGVALSSTASGGGELNYLGLTHFYPLYSLPAWGSGTGAAGLIGAGAYSIATTTLGLGSRSTLLAFSVLPVLMLVGYFVVLPPRQDTAAAAPSHDDDADDDEEREGLLSSPISKPERPFWDEVRVRLQKAQSLFFPYMLPLLLVYVAEYTINQGVSPALLFPLDESPFSHFRDFYPAYNAIYQVGVFISRSSIAVIRIRSSLYLPSLLQVANLALLILHAVFGFIPSVYLVFVVIFWEGLLGGLVYVNTFADITDQVAPEDREFSLSATTVSDSAGICLAALLSMFIEPRLCSWQVSHGIDYCRRT